MKNIEDLEFYSIEHWQEHWEDLMERVEDGETIGIENEKGERGRDVACRRRIY